MDEELRAELLARFEEDQRVRRKAVTSGPKDEAVKMVIEMQMRERQ